MQLRPLALALLVSACGSTVGPSETTTTPDGPPERELSPLTPPPRPWDELSMDERRAHMVSAVLPAMEDRFRAYDAARFDDFSCATCHGEDARARSFAMPNPALLPLFPTGTVGQEEILAAHTADCGFMFREVVPSMRALLGAPEFDAATGTGFSCYACHPHAAPDDPRNAPAAEH